MQMINEVTIMQQNKNLFNKILSYMKKHKNKKGFGFNTSNYCSSRYKYGTVEILVSSELSVTMNIDLFIKVEDIKIIKDSTKVYFCAIVSPIPKLKTQSYMTTDDLPLEYIHFYRFRTEHMSTEMDHPGLIKLLKDEGIDENSSHSYIKSTKLYKDLKIAFDEAVDKLQFNLVLDRSKSKVNLDLVNAVPLGFYDEKKDVLDLAYTMSSGKSINAKTERVVLSPPFKHRYPLEDLCIRALTYTPYGPWCRAELKNNNPKYNVQIL